MNNKLLLCLSLVLSSGLATKAVAEEHSSVQAYDDRKVGKIEVKIENLPEGSSYDKKNVFAKLRTQQGDPFSQYIFDQDLKQLAEDYDRIEPQIIVQDGEIDIILKVWLRPIINKIEWEGNEYIKTRTLKKELDIKAGTIFNRTEFNKAFNKVKEYYIKKGYFESQLSYRLVTDPKTREVNIVIDISEGRSGKVNDIIFHGFSKNEESDILHKLYTKKYSALTGWFTGKGRFMEEALEQDRLTIFNYLQDHGYADARVKIQILEAGPKGKIIIDIDADKGMLYRFGQVSFDGNILFSDEEVEQVFYAHPDSSYSPERLRKTAEAIKDLYGRKGFIDTSVTYETQLVQNAPIYNVHFRVDEGREYRIGMIRIIGNVQTESRVILRESLLIPGETFDSLKLKVTQARLENIGYFKSVNVYAVRTQDDLSLGDNYRDIYVEVEEQQTGNISLFSGFSSADNIFGGLDLTERNFNYKGISKVFSDGLSSVRGGGEFLHLRANFGPKQQTYLASWLTPYFLDTSWRLGFEFVASINNSLLSKDYDLNTYNVGAFVSYPLSPYLSYGFKYRVRNYNNDVSKSIDIPENADRLDPSADKGVLSGMGASLIYDSTDSALKPHRGLRATLEGEIVGLGGNADFFRTATINAYFTPLWRRGYMRYRADFRFLIPFGQTSTFADIPLSERFYLGGVSSVRGYKDFILGPRFDKKGKSGEIRKGKSDPAGGLSSSFLSIEYIQEILPIMDIFAFMDAGYVTDQIFDVGTYRMSYGIGTNLDILGRFPVTLGWGFPVNPLRGQKQPGHFFFTLGGQF
ncbi:MAG: Outer membrane protein assembly factor BamA [Chlamydiae bacterium]|nr:Outer membrane protein assembly factor BamA [Chlamydiota bacterium]